MSRFICPGALALALFGVTGSARAQELSLNGFGDMNYGYRFGPPANRSAAASFEAFGEDVHPKNTHSGFGLVGTDRSEEHTSELQSQSNLVCRLLLEKKKKK